MLNLLTFCDIPWWISWLMPFLLGLVLGWVLWSRFRSLFNDNQAALTTSQVKLVNAEAKVAQLQKQISSLDGDLLLCRGRLRELESLHGGSDGAVLVTPLAEKSAKTDKWALAIGSDQFQVIEGIGPKMEAILKENEIGHFEALALATPESLRNLLNKYGDKYRIIDPTTWPVQARLIQESDYQSLITLQKSLDGSRSDSLTDGASESKLEKFLIKAGVLKKWKQDDLKAIEGIGPKIEALLHDAGVQTWWQLAHTEVGVLNEILEKAGPRFQLADPSTWPRQSLLAAEGRWEELEAFQDALNGGK